MSVCRFAGTPLRSGGRIGYGSAPMTTLTDDKALEHRLRDQLIRLYGPQLGERTHDKLLGLIGRYSARLESTARTDSRLAGLSAKDVMVITYGDQLRAPGETPLQTLGRWFTRHLASAVNRIHILPFYPYSSDDGFSVIDYFAVDPA